MTNFRSRFAIGARSCNAAIRSYIIRGKRKSSIVRRLLFVSQRHLRIHERRTLRRKMACQQRDEHIAYVSNWNLAEAATSSFAVSFELKLWVQLKPASAMLSLVEFAYAAASHVRTRKVRHLGIDFVRINLVGYGGARGIPVYELPSS